MSPSSKSPPDPGPHNPAPLAFKLHHLGRQTGEAMDQALSHRAVTVGQGKFLRHLVNSPYGATPAELAGMTQSSRANVTQMLGRLRNAGFITRRDNPDDGRSAKVFVTPKGRRALEQGLQALVEFEQQLRDTLGPTGVQQLWTLLNKLS